MEHSEAIEKKTAEGYVLGELLPEALKNANPLGLLRLVNNQPTREALQRGEV